MLDIELTNLNHLLTGVLDCYYWNIEDLVKIKANQVKKGFYEDGLAALNFLSKQKISSMETIIYGESLGCGVAVKLSTENNFYATILEAPYTSISDVAQKHYWYLPAKWLVLDRFDALGIIKNIRSPLLVIHGSKDNVISINFGKKYLMPLQNPKNLYL